MKFLEEIKVDKLFYATGNNSKPLPINKIAVMVTRPDTVKIFENDVGERVLFINVNPDVKVLVKNYDINDKEDKAYITEVTKQMLES